MDKVFAFDMDGVIADTLGWEKFHLVGHDWGAFVAWAAAGLNPDRILSLSPISVPHPEACPDASGPERCRRLK